MSGIKVVFLGPQASGKTSIINSLVHNNFDSAYMGTVGVDFSTHSRTTTDEREVVLQIWDTAGQERFYSIIPAYIRTALGVFLVFDVTDRESFLSMRSWYQLVMQETGSDPVIVVLANKVDLDSDRAVPCEEASKFAASIDALYFEVSAKESTGVSECADAMAKKLLDRRMPVLAIGEGKTVKLSSETVNDQGLLPCGVCY